VRADLERSGQFRTLPEAQIVEKPTRGSEIKFPPGGAEAGLHRRRPRARCRRRRYRVEYEMFDVATSSACSGWR
jgi:TolB protein